MAVIARAEIENGVEEERRRGDPARPAGLARRDPPASTGLVDVAPGERLELANPHPRGVEDERRQAVALRQQANYRLDVLRRRGLHVPAFFPWELDRQAIAGRIRLHTRVIENHREDADRLTDGLLPEPLLVKRRYEACDCLGIDIGDRPVSESRQEASQGDLVGLEGAGSDIDPRRLPSFRDNRERGGGRLVSHQAEIGST